MRKGRESVRAGKYTFIPLGYYDYTEKVKEGKYYIILMDVKEKRYCVKSKDKDYCELQTSDWETAIKEFLFLEKIKEKSRGE